jgi:hypothetical protein
MTSMTPLPPDLPTRFRADILANRHNRAILARWPALALPDAWLVAGCLFQTVWNLQAGRPPEADIKDYDLFYFDASDMSESGERRVQARVDELLGDLGVTIEASNQARVHLWYEAHFGHPYQALRSSSDGIACFLVPATCVGVRPDALCAPYGLERLYEGVLAMNPRVPSSGAVRPKGSLVPRPLALAAHRGLRAAAAALRPPDHPTRVRFTARRPPAARAPRSTAARAHRCSRGACAGAGCA